MSILKLFTALCATLVRARFSTISLLAAFVPKLTRTHTFSTRIAKSHTHPSQINAGSVSPR